MEIYHKEKDNYISVWLTKEEEQIINRKELSNILLANTNKKCKVIFFLSGDSDLYANTEGLIVKNLGCA